MRERRRSRAAAEGHRRLTFDQLVRDGRTEDRQIPRRKLNKAVPMHIGDLAGEQQIELDVAVAVGQRHQRGLVPPTAQPVGVIGCQPVVHGPGQIWVKNGHCLGSRK